MLRTLVTSAQRLLAEISQHRSPDRIAMGIALGTSFGLVPMDNLVSVGLLLAILFLPIHQLSASIAIAIVAILSPMLWPIPDAIGRWFFSMSWARSCVASLHALPLMPWFRLNNTVVMGGILFGLTTWMPQYLVMRWMARRAQRQLADWSVDEIAEEAISYRKAIAAATRFQSITQAAALPHTPPPPLLTPAPQIVVETAPTAAMVLNITSVPAVLTPFPEAVPAHALDATETVLRETIIEVVRFRQSSPHVSSSIEPKQEVMIVEQNLSGGNESTMTSHVIPTSAPGMANSSSVKLVFDPIHQPLIGPKSSNSLRYLMRHLTASRDTHQESETHS